MATKKKRQSKPLHLTLHQLLSALSFWGTTVRMLLFGFLATVALFVGLSQTDNASAEVGLYIYVMGSVFLFDIGYTLLARGLPVTATTDKLIILLGEILLATLYVLPYFAMVPAVMTWVLSWTLLVVFAIISGRALVGLLYSR